MQQKQQKNLSQPLSPQEQKLRLIAMFSLARKAGKLVAGADMVKDAVLSRRVSTVFIASDLAPKSRKEIQFACRPGEDNPRGAQVVPIPVQMDEMAVQIGRRSGILAVTDAGFEKKLRSLAEELSQKPETQKTDHDAGRESC